MNNQRVVCAVVKYQDGKMLVGARHFDQVMMEQYKIYYAGGEAPEENTSTQGFIDNFGNFLNRYEALDVAIKANQIMEKTNPKDRLFSEDLY